MLQDWDGVTHGVFDNMEQQYKNGAAKSRPLKKMQRFQ